MNLGEDTGVEVEESTFWERVGFWVWGFLDILIFRHKAVTSSSIYEVWTRMWSTGVGMAKKHKVYILVPQDFDTIGNARRNSNSR